MLDIVSMVAGGQNWFVVRLTRQQARFLCDFRVVPPFRLNAFVASLLPER